MKNLCIALVVGLFLVASANAQDEKVAAGKNASASNAGASASQTAPTPEMWFYEQRLREYMDPKLAIRRVAQQKAAQRQARMAAMKWFGYSNSRPIASPDPFNSSYSPGWAGNNSLYPYRWSGYGPQWVVMRPYEGNY